MGDSTLRGRGALTNSRRIESIRAAIRKAHEIGPIFESHWMPLREESYYLRRKREGVKRKRKA